ncbi:DNA-directed RNA polymerase III subunit rpc25 [Actinomortierella ambigua]|uniref:DNA-directed RNA polymerase III subunit RPC8 n=1 Tax=Actinomortierella ambigua TaxID=1343610 RepID=A0A9P6PQI0_9FUNG|nr:DNA-directed RNA polymerase III subunit rpc25 [Actinomortierella ambigua]
MFNLAEIKDVIKIEPSGFRNKKAQALTNEINRKYANKVLQDVGLCVAMYDILHAGEGFINHGDGCSYVTVYFRLIIFRPFVGEIMTGKIRSCNQDGVKVTLGFFDDILIPYAHLQPNSEFNSDEQVWVWMYDENEMFMDLEEDIRFRVESESFHDTSPSVRPKKEGADTPDMSANSVKQPPYSLVCSINGDGLGLLSWWGA